MNLLSEEAKRVDGKQNKMQKLLRLRFKDNNKFGGFVVDTPFLLHQQVSNIQARNTYFYIIIIISLEENKKVATKRGFRDQKLKAMNLLYRH